MDNRLKRAVAGFQVVNIFLIYPFSTMVRVGIVDTLGAVDRGARSAAWGAPIALVQSPNIRRGHSRRKSGRG